MNEQLQQALAAILNRSVNALDAGTTFLQEQLPDVIQQLLVWKLLSHLIPMVLSALVLACLLVAAWRLYRTIMADPRTAAYAEKSRQCDIWLSTPTGSDEGAAARKKMREAEQLYASLPNKQEVYVPLGVFLGVAGSVTAFVMLIHLNLTWLQILVAPKLYLIEYAASLAK